MRILITLAISGLFAVPAMAQAHTANQPPQHEGRSTVVVSQGGSQLTMADIDSYAHNIPDNERARVFASPSRIESILRSLLVTKQLAREALNAQGQPHSSESANFSIQQYQALSKARIEELHSELQKQIPDMTELAHERYLANPDAFRTPRKVDVRHILISTKDRDDAKAKALAERLYQELEKDPSRFHHFVDEYSDDKSKEKNHGLVEFANSDRTVKQFREAAGQMDKAGEILGPVKTLYGYHILEAVRITPAHAPDFAEIKNQLVEELRKHWVDARVQEHIDALRSKKIEADPKAVASLRTRYLDEGKLAMPETPADGQPALATPGH